MLLDLDVNLGQMMLVVAAYSFFFFDGAQRHCVGHEIRSPVANSAYAALYTRMANDPASHITSYLGNIFITHQTWRWLAAHHQVFNLTSRLLVIRLHYTAHRLLVFRG